MSLEEGKVLGKELSEMGNTIGERFREKFPHSALFPSAKVDIASGESPDGQIVQCQILITMKREDAAKFWFPDEDMKAAMDVMKPQVLIIGDERVKGGLFVLYSKLEESMLRVKFSTKAEAVAYAEHFELGQYKPMLVKMAISEDVWFDGRLKEDSPDNVGYRKIPPRMLGKE